MSALRAGTVALRDPATLLWTAPVALVLVVPLLRREPVPLGVLPILVALAIIVVTDLRARLIPDVVTLPALAWAIGVAVADGRAAASLVGASVVGGALWVLAVIARGGIGGGDVKLGAVIGAALGWESAVLVLAVSQLVGAVIAAGLLLTRRGTRRTRLPIGSVIAILAALTILSAA